MLNRERINIFIKTIIRRGKVNVRKRNRERKEANKGERLKRE
jgi:hypothetical protein